MFLKLETNQQRAWDLGNPKVVTHNYSGQIHLRPYDPKPYRQITDSAFDLPFNDAEFTAGLVTCDGTFYDLEDHIQILQLIDQNNIRQIYIQLAYLPFDFGGELVVLRITSVKDEETYTYFSNPFRLTISEINKTTRLDYKITQTYDFSEASEEINLFYQSIRVAFYYNDYLPATEADIYYQISTSQEVNPRISEKYHKQWCFEFADPYTLKRVERAFYRSPCYLDFVRNYIVETPDKEARQGDSNISETFIITNEDEKDIIFIADVIPNEPLQLFLASSDEFASADYLVSQEYI
jgi:hypothetical protein